MRILITGGAGFVGTHLALLFKEQNPEAEVLVLDNLHRRGGELNLPLLANAGIAFHHGDIRVPSDLEALPGHFDLLLEAAAEPSVQAGIGPDSAGPAYVTGTNLLGTLNCLEFARRRAGAVVFLSTSRVYAVEALRQIACNEAGTRLVPQAEQSQPGVGTNGIAEEFSTQGVKSFYGASKLASELFVQEYAHNYNLRAAIFRCGVIAGPGQWGNTDQGIFTFWLTSHHWQKPLRYTGFGGTGKQVRDLLHPRDLFRLIQLYLGQIEPGCPVPYNVGGGLQGSVSLQEWTVLCQRATGHETFIAQDTATHAVDVPLYISDNSRVSNLTGWMPEIGPRAIALEMSLWVRENQESLARFFK